MDNTVALAALTLAGTIAGGFFTLVNKQNKTHEKLATTMDRVALATEKSADEAKERNGHLAELIIETAKNTKEEMNKPVNVQTVETQVVREQK